MNSFSKENRHKTIYSSTRPVLLPRPPCTPTSSVSKWSITPASTSLIAFHVFDYHRIGFYHFEKKHAEKWTREKSGGGGKNECVLTTSPTIAAVAIAWKVENETNHIKHWPRQTQTHTEAKRSNVIVNISKSLNIPWRSDQLTSECVKWSDTYFEWKNDMCAYAKWSWCKYPYYHPQNAKDNRLMWTLDVNFVWTVHVRWLHSS